MIRRLALAVTVFATASAPASAVIRVVGSTFSSSVPDPWVKAESLKVAVEVSAADGDIIKVRNGPFRFMISGTLGRKPLTIDKNIQLIADAGLVVLEGQGQGNFTTGSICTDCFAIPTSCAWTSMSNGDNKPLVLINSPRITNRQTWDIQIKNFEIRYAVRTGVGYIHMTQAHPVCTNTKNIRPGGAIEAWYTTLTLEDCYIHHNTVTGYAGLGGGVFTSSTNLTITDCKFENNYGGYYGGALFVSEGALGNGGPCCHGSVPPGENPPRLLFPRSSCTLTMTSTILRENFAEFGAGLQVGTQACTACDLNPPAGSYCDDPPTAQSAPRVTLKMIDNLIAHNCVARFDGIAGSTGSGVYLGSQTTIKSIRHNTFVGNKNKDNTGALWIAENGARVESDSIVRNVFANNEGGGLYVQCSIAVHDSCIPPSGPASDPNDWCAQGYSPNGCTGSLCRGVLHQVEHNLFFNNKEVLLSSENCGAETSEAHVVIGLGRKLAELEPSSRRPPPCTVGVTNWTCTSHCNEDDPLTHYRALWADDPGIGACTLWAPRVELTNKTCDPNFCSMGTTSDYEVSCCSPAVTTSFGGGKVGWKRTPCSGTSACPGVPQVDLSSMAASSAPSYAGYISVSFHFETPYSTNLKGATESFVVEYQQTYPTTGPVVTLSCPRTPASDCSFSPCAGNTTLAGNFLCQTTKFKWRVQTTNCRGGSAWTAYKNSTVYCIE